MIQQCELGDISFHWHLQYFVADIEYLTKLAKVSKIEIAAHCTLNKTLSRWKF